MGFEDGTLSAGSTSSASGSVKPSTSSAPTSCSHLGPSTSIRITPPSAGPPVRHRPPARGAARLSSPGPGTAPASCCGTGAVGAATTSQRADWLPTAVGRRRGHHAGARHEAGRPSPATAPARSPGPSAGSEGASLDAAFVELLPQEDRAALAAPHSKPAGSLMRTGTRQGQEGPLDEPGGERAGVSAVDADHATRFSLALSEKSGCVATAGMPCAATLRTWSPRRGMARRVRAGASRGGSPRRPSRGRRGDQDRRDGRAPRPGGPTWPVPPRSRRSGRGGRRRGRAGSAGCGCRCAAVVSPGAAQVDDRPDERGCLGQRQVDVDEAVSRARQSSTSSTVSWRYRCRWWKAQM